ncbi:hypothetical protein HJFPF1_02226 [Paramyrothecium foliicola]|nr:hypothetical protein HJFPF1_02226 [Paramyrothecium foliicola]
MASVGSVNHIRVLSVSMQNMSNMRFPVAKWQWRAAAIGVAALSAGVAAWTPPPEFALFASSNGHYFQTIDKEPFFWQADTAWFLVNRLTFDEADRYLADRAKKGFNVVQAIGAHPDSIKEPDALGNPSWINGDPFKPNDAHWDFVDTVMEHAWKTYGIRVVLHPAWGKYVHNDAGDPGFFNDEAARNFGEYIGKRYPYVPKVLFGDTNPVWKNKTAVRNDYAYGGLLSAKRDHEILDFSSVYDAFAEGIIEGEREALGDLWGKPLKNGLRYEPMITMHPQNQWMEGGPLALSSSFFGDRAWLTFDTSQSGHSDYPPNPPIPWWSCRRGWEPAELMYAVGETTAGKKRPALENEPHYEWRYNNARSNLPVWNASDVRIGNWQTAFTGMAGLTYGANAVWLMTSDRYPNGGGGPPIPWYEAINLPGAAQVQYVKKAILDRGERSFFDRIPAQDIIVGNPGISDARIAAMRDREGSWLMVYSPNSTISIDTSSLKGCNVTASWFNPINGNYTPFDYKQCGCGKVRQFQLPPAEDHKDWTLVLETK